jgi:uncharacterized protein
MDAWLITAPILFLVATLYASVGLGGGTAYLSVLSFFTADPDLLRPMAWGLNVVVATVGVYNFHRKGHFDWKAIRLFLISGLFGAAIGAGVPIGQTLFSILLAGTLLALGMRMLLVKQRPDVEERECEVGLMPGLGYGFAAGFFSGLVGIGGGIILGPIVLALGLLPMKKCAAMTSAYIWICSAGALVTHFAKGGTLPWSNFAMLSAVVVVGGFIGSRFGAGKASPILLQRIFAFVVLAAAINQVIKLVSTAL